MRIQGNSIHDNGWLGIDLVPTGFGYGVDPNDPLDADLGGNRLQNHPEIASATLLGSTLHVVGNLPSSPNGTFTVELFASPTCDDSGSGEGQTFLGRTTVVTDAAGNAPIDMLLTVALSPGQVLTTTAIDEANGDTSEFSPCVPIDGGAAGQPFCFGDGGGTACPCGNSGAAGHGCANGTFPQGCELLAGGTPSVGGTRSSSSPSAAPPRSRGSSSRQDGWTGPPSARPGPWRFYAAQARENP